MGSGGSRSSARDPHPCRSSASGALALLGLVSAAGYALVLHLEAVNGAAPVLRFLGLFALLFGLYIAAARVCRWLGSGDRRALVAVFGFAALFRGILLLAGLPSDDLAASAWDDLRSQRVGYRRFLLYDQDVWRYLWDGHVAAAGLNPYAHTPDELEDFAFRPDHPAYGLLNDDRWQEIFENVAYRGHRTVYPPLAQLAFRGLHGVANGSVLAWKAFLSALDLGTCLLLCGLLSRLGRRRLDVVLYAWNPLVVKEIAGSGHVDAMVVLGLTAAVTLIVSGRQATGLAAYAASALAKVTPLVLLGPLLRRTPPRLWFILPLALGVVSWPYAGDWRGLVQGLAGFGREWTFNAGVWAAVRGAAEAGPWPDHGALVAHSLWLGTVLVLAAWWTLRPVAGTTAWLRRLFLMLTLFLLLGPTLMPWYTLWALPLAVAVGGRAWIAATGLVFLSYAVYIDETEHLWWLVVEHGTIWALLAVDLAQRTAAVDIDELVD